MDRATLEWQSAGNGSTMHVIDTAKPHGRWAGPRALCKRYPQRNYRAWFSLAVDETPDPAPYDLQRCPECVEALAHG